LFINGDLRWTRNETVVAFGLCGLASCGSGQGQVAGCYEYSGCIKWEFLGHLSDYKLLQRAVLLGVNSQFLEGVYKLPLRKKKEVKEQEVDDIFKNPR
jgi:hypothetical protein